MNPQDFEGRGLSLGYQAVETLGGSGGSTEGDAVAEAIDDAALKLRVQRLIEGP
jgi:hypothetical protein